MFIQHLSSRMKKMFNGLGFKVTFIVVLLFCLLNTVTYVYTDSKQDSLYEIQASEALLINEHSPFSYDFRMVTIFLLTLPFAFSYFRDYRLNIKPVLQTKYGVKQYYIVNLLTCFLGTFLAFFVPLIIEVVINELIFNLNGTSGTGMSLYSYNHSATLTGKNAGEVVYNPGLPLLRLYLNYPELYNVVYITLFSGFVSLMATFVYSISYWVKKYAMILLLPIFLIYTIQEKFTAYSVEIFNWSINFQAIDYCFVNWVHGIHWGYFISLCLFFLVFIVVSTGISMKRDQL